jgi:hypothetical protein
MNCREFEEALPLYLYGELSPAEREACAAHAAECATCGQALKEVGRLHEVLSERPRSEPSPDLLVHCRQSLEEALDRGQLGWHGLVRQWVTPLHFRPASGVAVALFLMVFGFSLGWTIRPRAAGLSSETGPSASPFNLGDIENMRINGISRVAPDPKTGDVRITMDAERRVTLQGSLDDPTIQRVLVYAVKSYDNPGIRRDTLDALRVRSSVPTVRRTLLWSMRHDPNLGVRLEALDAVRGLEWDTEMRQAFLEALEHDTNPGIRVAAIDVLAGHADETVLSALERIAASDSNRDVRLKCVSAMTKLTR